MLVLLLLLLQLLLDVEEASEILVESDGLRLRERLMRYLLV